MIHKIHSSLQSFKTLEFKPGLNVLLSQKSQGAKVRQTRNRAGKTSMVEIVHFLLGASADKKSLFLGETLQSAFFSMEIDLRDAMEDVARTGQEKYKNKVSLLTGSKSVAEWREQLGEAWFSIPDEEGAPAFRSLFSYFARRELDHGFNEVASFAKKQGEGARQMAIMYLLGLDWKIARDWQRVRDREKQLKEVEKTAKSKAFSAIVGKSSDLRTGLALSKDRRDTLRKDIAAFRVHPEYAKLEQEASAITRKVNELADANTMDHAAIKDIEAALASENPPATIELQKMYELAGITLPGLVQKRYDEVREFHGSVVRNRKDYLGGELSQAKERIQKRNAEKEQQSKRLSEVMAVLKSHGALAQYSAIQSELNRHETEVEMLQTRLGAAEQLESGKNESEIERNRLQERLRRDFHEQDARVGDAILAFETTSRRLYENTGAGSLKIDVSRNGPILNFPIQGSRSKGIRNMQIFCFDMMLMRLCAKRGIGPGFLIHDSHLFDGVDGRQIQEALQIGAETADELGFQYIVTMNEDDAYKERSAGFDLDKYVLPVRLTDATADGGLFGIRFD